MGINRTKNGLIVIVAVVFAAGAGTAYAGMVLPTINLSGNVLIIGDTEIEGRLIDTNDEAGTSGQLLSSTEDGIDWIDATGATGATGMTGMTGPPGSTTQEFSFVTITQVADPDNFIIGFGSSEQGPTIVEQGTSISFSPITWQFNEIGLYQVEASLTIMMTNPGQIDGAYIYVLSPYSICHEIGDDLGDGPPAVTIDGISSIHLIGLCNIASTSQQLGVDILLVDDSNGATIMPGSSVMVKKLS